MTRRLAPADADHAARGGPQLLAPSHQSECHAKRDRIVERPRAAQDRLGPPPADACWCRLIRRCTSDGSGILPEGVALFTRRVRTRPHLPSSASASRPPAATTSASRISFALSGSRQ